MRKKYDIVQVLLFLTLLLSMCKVATAFPRVQYNSSFSPAEITIGDRITYIVTVTHEPGLKVFFSLPDSLQRHPFVLVGFSSGRPVKRTAQFRAQLTAFEHGDYSLPPVFVTLLDTLAGEEQKRTVSAESKVRIKALTDSSMTELQPLTPLMQPYRSWAAFLLPYGIGIGVVAVLLLAGYFLIRRSRSLPEPVKYSRSVVSRLRKLEKRFDKGLSSEACCIHLSALVREYLEGRYQIRTFEKVTAEIVSDMNNSSVPHADIMKSALERADLVKFAGSSPSRDECMYLLDRVRGAIAEP